MNTGWIKLHTKIVDSPIFADSRLLQLAIYLLINANWKDKKTVMGNTIIDLKRGQLITGRKSITHALTGIENEKNKEFKKMEFLFYRKMILLEKLEFLHIKSTTKYSVITIKNYDQYQDNAHQPHNNTTTDAQQMHTPKEVKTIKTIPNGIQGVWDFYLLHSSTKEKLTDGRTTKIKARLKVFTIEEIQTAIEHCFKSKFHTGTNDRGWKANADYVFRSDEIIDNLKNLNPKEQEKQNGFSTPEELKAKGLLW